jgi:L-proline amide hydrolase
MRNTPAPSIRRMKVLWGTTATWRCDAAGAAGDRPEMPLVVVPGGPGLPHGYLRCLVGLARPGRPVVFYDPRGCGRSRAADSDVDGAAVHKFTTLVDEFRMIVEHFAGDDGCFVLGHSSGGWIALEGMIGDAATRSRVLKLVLASAPLDVPAFITQQKRLISSLGVRAHRRLRRPPPVRGRRAAAYDRAYERFLHEFICRAPWPMELVETMAHSNRALYEALWGPSEVYVTGELRTWSCTDRVGVLDIPILLTSGRHDEVVPLLMEQAMAVLPRARWRLFAHSAHMPHLEEPEQYLATVEGFLS